LKQDTVSLPWTAIVWPHQFVDADSVPAFQVYKCGISDIVQPENFTQLIGKRADVQNFITEIKVQEALLGLSRP
jgi:hypothetical protein